MYVYQYIKNEKVIAKYIFLSLCYRARKILCISLYYFFRINKSEVIYFLTSVLCLVPITTSLFSYIIFAYFPCGKFMNKRFVQKKTRSFLLPFYSPRNLQISERKNYKISYLLCISYDFHFLDVIHKKRGFLKQRLTTSLYYRTYILSIFFCNREKKSVAVG